MDAFPHPPRLMSGDPDDRLKLRRWSAFLGLCGGVLILTAAFVLALMMTFLGLFGAWPAIWGWGSGGGLPIAAAALLVSIWGLLSGGLVLYMAWRVADEDENTLPAGVGLVAGGLLSYFALGGFLVGGLLAIGAGVLAVAGSKPLVLERAPRYGGA